jgi:hypothetical protein
VIFKLRSSTGKEIDRFIISYGDSDWQEISDLFDAARRIALSIDEAIGLIVTELKMEKSVGKDPHQDTSSPNDKSEEDLPF